MKFFSISSSSSITGVLRRIFCFKTSLPTPNELHENITNFRNYSDEKIGSSPGIVARLMGLDSMPLMDLTNIPIEKGTNSISKEGILESLEENSVPYHPFFLLKHEADYIVISFDDDRKEKRSKGRRRRRKRSRSFDGKEEKGKENQDPRKDGKFEELRECFCTTGNSEFATEKGMSFSEKSNCEKPSKGREQNKALYSSQEEVKEQSNSENYSPPLVAKSGEGLVHGSLNSRRKLPMELGNREESSPFKPITDIINNDTLGEIREMARGDVIKSNWIGIQLWQLEDIEGIVAECETQIIEKLLDELVDQLIDISLK